MKRRYHQPRRVPRARRNGAFFERMCYRAIGNAISRRHPVEALAMLRKMTP